VARLGNSRYETTWPLGHVHNRITTVGDSCSPSSLGVYSPDTKGRERESPECILQLDRGSRQSGARTGSLLWTYTKYVQNVEVEKPGKTIVLYSSRDNCNSIIRAPNNSAESKFVS